MNDLASIQRTVLVIDDEEPIRRFLRAALETNGFKVIEAASGEEGIRHTATYQPDAILLDLGLPGIDGMDVISKIRDWSSLPILVLSARGQEDDKVRALESGADDYLTKPFAVRELLARLGVSLRHRAQKDAGADNAVFHVGALEVDFSLRTVRLRGELVHLTPIEFKLLTVLIRHAGKVVTHRQLLTEVWGKGNLRDTHYLRVYMGHLRHKLEDQAAQPKFLLTEPGIGYRLVTDVEHSEAVATFDSRQKQQD